MMAMAEAFGGYLWEHPEELLRVAKNATKLRVGVPLATLRWLARELGGRSGAVREIEIDAEPPGLRLGASLALLGTPIRARAVLRVDEVCLGEGELRVKLSFSEVELSVLDPSVETPVSALIRSGALDLSQAGNLVQYMPRRPPFIVEAREDYVVIDLAKHPKIGTRLGRRLLGVIAPLIGIRSIETDPQHLDVAFGPFPQGVSTAWGMLRRAI